MNKCKKLHIHPLGCYQDSPGTSKFCRLSWQEIQLLGTPRAGRSEQLSLTLVLTGSIQGAHPHGTGTDPSLEGRGELGAPLRELNNTQVGDVGNSCWIWYHGVIYNGELRQLWKHKDPSCSQERSRNTEKVTQKPHTKIFRHTDGNEIQQRSHQGIGAPGWL